MKIRVSILSLMIFFGCNSLNKQSSEDMKLWTLSDYGQTEKTITENASDIDVIKIMKELDWNKFHQVILEQNNGDLMEVGGSLNEDGLSVLYQENEKQYVISSPPATVIEMTNFLLMYLQGNEEFKTQYKFE